MGKGHYFLPMIICIVLVSKANICIYKTHYVMRSNGHFMGVSAQVVDNMLRVGKG